MILANDPLDRSAPPWSWTAVADLIRLRNQSGTWLLMLPSLWSLVLANHGRPPLALMGVFVLGAFVMRSLGVVFNDLADRNFDKHVARTSSRPLADGRLVPRQALLVALILTLCAALLVLALNPFTMLLSPIALFLAAIYPFSKRWIHMPQAVLGIAFGWGAIMAWAASCGRIDPLAWLLFGATICWAMAYDTIYALQDREDDRRIGVKSSALFFGEAVPEAVGLFLGGMVVCLVLAGQLSSLRMEYYLVLALLSGLFLWQVLRLKASVTPHAAFIMFQQHVYAGAVVLLGIWFGAFNSPH
ncbi:MAG: 4-hydroxybenzoate octaprenyltransferase [Nitrospira defluvii]|nr:4-hydroxybenzoate octaprenyltransferase [Nitrospira defluvii]